MASAAIAARCLDAAAALLRAQRVHMVGIGGSGMRALAELLAARGCTVTGSDERNVQVAGARVTRGHALEYVPGDADVLVYSAAIEPDNRELSQARSVGMPTLNYPAAVGALLAEQHGIAIAGTHGKSTTAAMTAAVLVTAGLDPSTLIGATPVGCSSGGRLGRGDLLVAEACEYREHFLALRPRVAAILNIEPDHFDYYRSPRALRLAFARFARQVAPSGYLLFGESSSVARKLATHARCRCETFGFRAAAHWRATGLAHRRGRYRFQISYRGKRVCPVELVVPGRHNVLNALAAAALASRAGVPPTAVAAGLGGFRGLERRLEVGKRRGVLWIDDYAHHPTEIRAALAAVREMAPGRRVWCVFQPHQVSRTHYLLDALAQTLQNADKLVVADIFQAREPEARSYRVTAGDLAERARSYGADVATVHAPQQIAELLDKSLRKGDALVTLGAGDIRKIVDGSNQRV